MKIKKGFVVRNVGGEYVVVPVGAMSKQFHGMIHLNETGSFLWNFYAEEHTLEEGVNAILNEYDVEREIATADVEQFIKIILEHNFAE